jgi:hypothetical protein
MQGKAIEGCHGCKQTNVSRSSHLHGTADSQGQVHSILHIRSIWAGFTTQPDSLWDAGNEEALDTHAYPSEQLQIDQTTEAM